MNRAETQEAIKVMQAFVDGIEVEFHGQQGSWTPVPSDDCTIPTWNFASVKYRIKPKPLEVWVWMHHSGGMNGDAYFAENACRAMHQSDTGRAVRFIEAPNE